ncbi:MotA/TolQ/ExbB proton channel family protein [bacterium]|nr:MotA/TolQ/ExbB proton channel family protein [bacterium]
MADSSKKTEGQQIKPSSGMKGIWPVVAIVLCAIVAHFVFYNFFGDYKNFEGGEEAYMAQKAWVDGGEVGEAPAGLEQLHPVNEGVRRIMGLVFKGGFVIPIGFTLLLTLLVFTVERAMTVLSASGKGNTDVFVEKVRRFLSQGDISAASLECDKQKGSVGNVIKAGLRKYQEMEVATGMQKDQKKAAIQAELEEATMLELPMLERNLSIIATTASLGTLVGLIGTVIGMIKAFSALGAAGAPNAAELSVGISEALINTALGISTSAFSILIYNFFTTKIDSMTYKMDEAGYSIVQTFDIRN